MEADLQVVVRTEDQERKKGKKDDKNLGENHF
jgi:hypothetical protein